MILSDFSPKDLRAFHSYYSSIVPIGRFWLSWHWEPFKIHYPRSAKVSYEKSIENLKTESHSLFYRLGNNFCKSESRLVLSAIMQTLTFRYWEPFKWYWGKVFKNGTSNICGRQPLKNLKHLSMPHHFKLFNGCLPHILLGPFLNTLSHMQVEKRFPMKEVLRISR